MKIRWPPRLKTFGVWSEADGGCIIDERVEPHIDDAVRIPGQRDTPRLPGPADRDVVKPTLNQSELLVATRIGLGKIRGFLEVIEQRLLVLRQSKEIVLLFNPLRLCLRVLRAAAVHELFLRLERFASDAVPALVHTFVDVAGVVNPLNHINDSSLVSRLRRPDEIVIRQIQPAPRPLEYFFHPI